ncbi:ABP1 [Candida jiufengensis]|uniref:ABP1 n=1 Tax=Candida jiufengensis TaxID=497108 RepID=UPI002225985F|nr:ABP1 [Candida jiufengensis]KAI5955119.1 ABP1 [Candida jiufengensis]
MEKIDTSTNSKRIQEPYNKVVRGDPSISYVVYSVDKNATLDVLETGSGDLNEFVENFTDGQVQFGLARVTVPGSDVFKNLLLGWCPDNAPAKLRLSFANNFAEISKIFSGYHIQITARDQDDLDVDEFLNRVGAAAGARYSTTPSSSKNSTGGSSSTSAKPTVSKPIQSKPTTTSSKPSFIPKSTGFGASQKPKNSSDDGWGDAQDVEERDFDEKPLENVPSTYKPTKVNINDLRKQKSDTISSTPKSKPTPTKEEEKDDNKPKPLSERMKAYDHHDDGRLTSLPKPKIGHSVADKYKASTKTSSNTPTFGAKPSFGSNHTTKEKPSGGLSRDFGAENGKTPAQIWAEKRGKYKTVAPGEEEEEEENDHDNKESQSHASELAHKFEQHKIDDDEEQPEQEEEEEKPAPLPARNFPPPPKRQPEPEPEDEDDEEEDEAPVKLPARNLPPPPPRQPEPEEDEDEEEEDEKPAKLPARNIPPPPSFDQDDDDEEEDDEAPVKLPARNIPQPPQAQAQSEPEQEQEHESESKGTTAVAEYDYEKDEDNEIGFEEGDLIIEIEFVDEDWWSGKHSKTGEIGLFPANYVSLN